MSELCTNLEKQHTLAKKWTGTIRKPDTISNMQKVKLDRSCVGMESTKHCAVALAWRPEGKRKQGRPKTTWRRTTEKERGTTGMEKLEHSQGGRQGQGKVARGPYMPTGMRRWC
jgi:hypothetical protein